MMMGSVFNPYPIQAAPGLLDDLLQSPILNGNRAAFDQRQVPSHFRVNGRILERVIALGGTGGRDARTFEASVQNMRRLYGQRGENAFREYASQEYLWNYTGIRADRGARAVPCIWVEVGAVRYTYEPPLAPGIIPGDEPYRIGETYSPGQTVTHPHPDTDQIVKWSAKDINRDGSDWVAGEFQVGQWNLVTGIAEPRLMLAAGVPHRSAVYPEFQIPVNERSWSLWEHSDIPTQAGFDPFKHISLADGGYPVWSTDELEQTPDNVNILQSPFAFEPITLIGRTVKATSIQTAEPFFL